MPTSPQHLIMKGMTIGLDAVADLKFTPNRPYTGCRICGATYQTDEQRAVMPDSPIDVVARATESRHLWSLRHARTHSASEHEKLAKSGFWCTPEAAHKLSSYGIIALSDAVFSTEHNSALAESNAIPANDAEA
jgi:hypothetical protein